MSEYREGYHLTPEELGALLAMGGQRTLLGLGEDIPSEISAEKVCQICCDLVREELMTLVDGKYRLCRGLYQVLLPIRMARTVCVLTPGSEQYPQTVYYFGEGGVTAMEPVRYGGYVLTNVDRETLAQRLGEELSLRFYDERLPEPAAAVPAPSPDGSWTALRQGASFLLERLDSADGQRLGWLRGTEFELEPWVQWTRDGQVVCRAMTRERLDEAVAELLKGA